MAKTTKEIIHLIQTILTEHDDFYDHYRSELRKYRDVYENKFWAPVSRVDNVFGDRNLICACPPPEAWVRDAEEREVA